MKLDKIFVSRIAGSWCLEYNCWPEDHPGCDIRYEKGFDGCPKSIKKISVGKSDERDNLSGEPVQ